MSRYGPRLLTSDPDFGILAQVAAPWLAGIRTVAEELDRGGWAPGNSGNLSVRLDEIPSFPGRRIDLDHPFTRLSGKGILITGRGTRMREVAVDPLAALCLLGFDGKGECVTLGEVEPSSELRVHLAAHEMLSLRRPLHCALVHSHPTMLTALSLVYPEPEAFRSVLLRSNVEMARHPDRITMLPALEPGSQPLAAATAKALEECSGVVWARHGVIASGENLDSALDLIQVAEKAAEVALLAGSVPRPELTAPARGRLLRGWRSPDGAETFYEVRSRDSGLSAEKFAQLERRPIHVVLDNLRSAFNVGSVFRLADACRVSEVVCCGYTAHPPLRKLEQTAMGSTAAVPWRHADETALALAELKERGLMVVGVETAKDAVPFHRFDYRFPCAIVFGNEGYGLSQSALAECDAFVDLPVFGYKNSVNVAAAAAVLLYHLLGVGGWLDTTSLLGEAGAGSR